MPRPTMDDMRVEIWDLRRQLDKAAAGDASRDVVSGMAYYAIEGQRDRYRKALEEIAHGQIDSKWCAERAALALDKEQKP